jgi:hypothetical protein
VAPATVTERRHRIPLKRVALGGSSFFVSNYRQEIEVPFADVARVSGSRFVNPTVVRLELRRSGPFGERIVFMPSARVFSFGQHPMVRELREVLSGRVIR